MVLRLSWKVYVAMAWVNCFILVMGNAQIKNSWIVAFESHEQDIEKNLKSNPLINNYRCVFKDLNLWSIEGHPDAQKSLKNFLYHLPNVNYIHPDYISEWRYVPNDPDFPSQWAVGRIGLNDVWDITTGGKAPNGDDIVVAIFDDGFQLDHPDYAANVWHNEAEIPDNGIDDDGNGYVDDYDGWNSTSLTDDHEIRMHGTSVTGIIGAIGDNQNQMAGAIWDVKLMLTSGGRQSGVAASDVIAAYEYIYEQRRLYNESDGAEGAYVVVSNYSGGVSNQFASDIPGWCDVLDQLGTVGVLNVGSAPNNNDDIDAVGDIPGSCPTDFLITVTNTDRLDQKVQNAGFGAIGIDIGAPGDDILTTTVGSAIEPVFFGTSAAAPHVAGTIALMYSLICPETFESSLTNPGALALSMKSAIMNSVDPVDNLSGITVSGGRLNAFAAITIIDESTIGDCCEVFLDTLHVIDESCISAQDAMLSIRASGRDIREELNYRITLDNTILENRSGDFNRLESGIYDIQIFDEGDMACRLDTSISLVPGMKECPFGNFEIIELRQNPNSITLGYSIDEQKNVQIQVHTSLGQLVYNQLVTPQLEGLRTHEIRTRSWASGVYHASILTTGFRDVKSFYVIEGL